MNLSRRSLLLAATAGIVAAIPMSADAILLGKTALLAPLVKPSVSWNGSAGTGGTAPVQATRVNGRPACRWMVADKQRAAANQLIGVDADALGGVSSVTFWVEGNTYVVTSPRRIPWIDANGNVTTRFGYWVMLNTAACVSQSPKTPTNGTAGNVVNVYAIATPANGAFTTQTLGPLTIYPEATPFSITKTIGSSGADFTSITLALNWLRANSYNGVNFQFTTTGFYDCPNSNGAHYASTSGWTVFTAAPGVTATIGRQTLDYANTNIDIRLEGGEFRGSGIQVDTRNFQFFTWLTWGYRFNGIAVITSEGTINSTYWANGYKPRASINYCTYAEDCDWHWQQTPIANLILAVNNRCYGYAELWSDNSLCAQGNWLEKADANFWRQYIDSFTITYTGPGATATVTRTGTNNQAGGALVLTDSVNGTFSYTLGTVPTDTWFANSAIAADINANRPGWVATPTGTVDSRRASCLIGNGFGSTNGFPATNAKNVVLDLATFTDIHLHGWQVFNTGLVENIIHRGQAQFQLDAAYTLMIFDQAVPLQDAIFIDFIFEKGGTGITIKSPCQLSHVVLRNHTITDFGLDYIFTTGSWNIDQYCAFEQCVMQAVILPSAPIPVYPALIDCCLPSPPSRAADAGNFVASQPFVNLAGHDLRLTGAPLSNLKTRLELFDAANNARAPTDVIGALATGYANPSWPVNV